MPQTYFDHTSVYNVCRTLQALCANAVTGETDLHKIKEIIRNEAAAYFSMLPQKQSPTMVLFNPHPDYIPYHLVKEHPGNEWAALAFHAANSKPAFTDFNRTLFVCIPPDPSGLRILPPYRRKTLQDFGFSTFIWMEPCTQGTYLASTCTYIPTNPDMVTALSLTTNRLLKIKRAAELFGKDCIPGHMDCITRIELEWQYDLHRIAEELKLSPLAATIRDIDEELTWRAICNSNAIYAQTGIVTETPSGISFGLFKYQY